MINSKKTRLTMFAASMVAAAALTGCFNDKSASNGPSITSFSSTAALGALVDASCDVVSKGGSVLQTYTTSAPNGTGAITVAVAGGDFPLIISCTGGTYFDEGTNQANQANTATLKSIVPSATALGQVANNVAVTTLTSMAVSVYESLPAGDRNESTALQSITNVIQAIYPSLLENGGALNLLQAPTPVTASDTQVSGSTFAGKYASVLAGLAKVAQSTGKTAAALASELATQAAGGTIDPTVVDTLVQKTQDYAVSNGDAALQNDVSNDNSGSGSVATPTNSGSNSGGQNSGSGATGG